METSYRPRHIMIRRHRILSVNRIKGNTVKPGDEIVYRARRGGSLRKAVVMSDEENTRSSWIRAHQIRDQQRSYHHGSSSRSNPGIFILLDYNFYSVLFSIILILFLTLFFILVIRPVMQARDIYNSSAGELSNLNSPLTHMSSRFEQQANSRGKLRHNNYATVCIFILLLQASFLYPWCVCTFIICVYNIISQFNS